MNPEINFAKPGDSRDWSSEWVHGLVAHLPEEIVIETVQVRHSGRHQISLEMTVRGRTTVISLDGDNVTGYQDRAKAMTRWFLNPAQQAAFDEADALWHQSFTVERAAALGAAERIDGAAFDTALRRFNAETWAQVRKDSVNTHRTHASLEVGSGLTIKRRKVDGKAGLRLRTRDYILTHLTFTPAVEISLPTLMLTALQGKAIEAVIDTPILRGGGLVISKAWTNGGSPSITGDVVAPRTSFEVESSPMAIEDAVRLIDERRAA